MKRILRRHLCNIKYVVKVRGPTDKLSHEHATCAFIELHTAQWEGCSWVSHSLHGWPHGTAVYYTYLRVCTWVFFCLFGFLCCRNMKIWWFGSESATPEMLFTADCYWGRAWYVILHIKYWQWIQKAILDSNQKSKHIPHRSGASCFGIGALEPSWADLEAAALVLSFSSLPFSTEQLSFKVLFLR